MNDFEILIIGAGISGLMAARELSKKGRKIAVLEARDRPGGRIHTIKPDGFNVPLETGAEFVHGNLPLTKAVVKEANIKFRPMAGEFYQIKNGKLLESEEFIEGFPELIKKLKQLKQDMSFEEFLDKYFGEKHYEPLRYSVRRYAEGYDAADTKRVSSFALRDEWINEEDSGQFRIEGGYKSLIDFLAGDSLALGCSVHLSTVVKEITWKKGGVEITADNGRHFTADKVLVTVPLWVLQQPEGNSRSYIRFSPEIPRLQNSAGLMGYGSVIKIFMRFRECFWQENKFTEQNIKQFPRLGFLISDAFVPTWWTQMPESTPLLTGWLAGPNADKLKSSDEESLISKALESLTYLFGASTSFLEGQLIAAKAVNWTSDPFSLGAYSYSTVGSKAALSVLTQSIEDTIFFAGEAIYEGPAMGTVEAALLSAVEASKKMSR